MSEKYLFDVFLSHSSRDKVIVRNIARKLVADGIRVWLDEWEIRPGDSIPSKIEEGLEHSQILVLCMSANAFGSEWAQLESYTFRFRDPLNRDRRFIPLRLDESEIKGSLAQFLYLSWLPADQTQSYVKLLDACRLPRAGEPKSESSVSTFTKKIISLGHSEGIQSVAISPDGSQALTGGEDMTVRLWQVESGQCIQVMEGHTGGVNSVAFSPDGTLALTGSDDDTVCLWKVKSGQCIRIMEGHTSSVYSVAFSPDGMLAVTGAYDKKVFLWEVKSGQCIRIMEGHTGGVNSVAFSPDGTLLLTGANDNTIRLWQVKSGQWIRTMVGHRKSVYSVAFSPDGTLALTGSFDGTVCLWEVESGQCIHVMKGHKERVMSVAFSPDGTRALTGASDKTIRLWQVKSGKCIRVIKGHSARVFSVAFSPNGTQILTGSDDKTVRLWQVESGQCIRVMEGHTDYVNDFALSPDGTMAFTGASDKTVRLWQMESGKCIRLMNGHKAAIFSVAFSPDGNHVLTGSADQTACLWEVESGQCIHVMKGHTDSVMSVAFSPDSDYALTGSSDKTIRLWQVKSGKCIRVIEGHSARVFSVAFSSNGTQILTGSDDKTVRLWQVKSGQCIRVLEGHTSCINSAVFSQDDTQILTGSDDNTVRLWRVESGQCIRVMEGHTDWVNSVAFSPDCTLALTGSDDNTVRLWEVESGRCIQVMKGHSENVYRVVWNSHDNTAWSISENGVAILWDLSEAISKERQTALLIKSPDQFQYTNAKVLLVGDSGAGKTGLSNYLALGIKDEQKNSSTDGAWATHWKLPHTIVHDGMEREVWLWDFAGQIDYRLVHQLFMDETAAAILVFDPQKENPFEGLGQWDNDLQKSTRKSFARLLVAGRSDRGGIVVSDTSMKKFMQERGFKGSLHITSAKTGEGCDELKKAIIASINWQNIPITTTPARYHRMKQEILHLRDQGVVLINLAELKQRMDMMLAGENFTLEELQAVLGLLAGPGMIMRLDFGDIILLRPDIISRYASALVRQLRKHPQELGCIQEDELLKGKLDYQDFERLPENDESILLRKLHEIVVRRAWCLRLPCDGMTLLIFPNYFRRERPKRNHHPMVVITYRFSGPIDEIYTTLVVQLNHTNAFDADELWKDAADFKTQTGQRLGLKLIRETEGSAIIEIYFNEHVDENSRLVFERYVYNHLKAYDGNLKRLRNYFCINKKCDGKHKPFPSQDIIDEALAPKGTGKVFCPKCGKSIMLRDAMELKFDSPEIKESTRKEEVKSHFKIDNESQELILIGHTFSIVAAAGQIYRSCTNSDHGIDGEIEFKDDQWRATGKRLYLQLKSGDSHLTQRKRDGAEVFQIKNPRWANYWQQQSYTVMLVIRNSKGEIRWMEISEYLKRESDNGNKPITQIVFTGEPFDVMSIRRWRDKLLK